MKKLVLSVNIVAFSFMLKSCTFNPGPTNVNCDWNGIGYIEFSNLNLKHPDGVSFMYNQKFMNQSITHLPNVLDHRGDVNYKASAAKITWNLKSDKISCIGEKGDTYKPLNKDGVFPSEVSGNSIRTKAPLGAFSGEATVKIFTDEFQNTINKSGEVYNAYYHVVWSSSSNKMQGNYVNLNGDLTGKKIPLFKPTGYKSIDSKPKLLLDNEGIIIGGTKKKI